MRLSLGILGTLRSGRVLADSGKCRATALTLGGPAVICTRGKGEPFGACPHLVAQAESGPDWCLVTSPKSSILEAPVCRALCWGGGLGQWHHHTPVPSSFQTAASKPVLGFSLQHLLAKPPCQARRPQRAGISPWGPESSMSCFFGFGTWEGAVCLWTDPLNPLLETGCQKGSSSSPGALCPAAEGPDSAVVRDSGV